MPTLVLLGAGASYGSEPANIGTPPLGDELFGELCNLGGIASGIPEEIKAVFAAQGFEQGMKAYYDRKDDELQAFHRELSSYLADFVPTQKSYYVELLNLLRGRNVIFSSLNYDMMLEEAIFMLGMNVSYDLERRVNSVRVLKPHGSINFWHDFPDGMFSGGTFSKVHSVLRARVRPVDRVTAKHKSITDTCFSPAMSMYVKGKNVPVCPDFVLGQQEMFSDACRRASRIIVIGVRVVKEDTHVWGPLLDSGSEITYFGGKKDEVEFKEWSEATGRKNVVFVDAYFDRALSHIEPFL